MNNALVVATNNQQGVPKNTSIVWVVGEQLPSHEKRVGFEIDGSRHDDDFSGYKSKPEGRGRGGVKGSKMGKQSEG